MKTIFLTTRSFWIIFATIKIINVESRRGPHHPRGLEAQSRPPKLDEHLEHEHDHLREDLGPWALKNNKLMSEMTDDEKNFYYFKVHDSDNNDVLDGLEMLQAATHRSGHLHKLNQDDELESMDDELGHIIDVIDDFLSYADLNQDGYLNYPEYAKGIQNDDVTNMEQIT